MAGVGNTVVGQRLHAALAAVCPILGVSVPTLGTSVGVRIDFDPSSTAPQQAAAQSALLTFDWSAAGDATYVAQAQKAAATASIDNGSLQVGTQFERLCVAVAQVALDAANNERAAMTAMASAVASATSLATLQTAFAAISIPPQVTGAQLVAAVKAKIAATAQ